MCEMQNPDDVKDIQKRYDAMLDGLAQLAKEQVL
jgi:hypothetical protein